MNELQRQLARNYLVAAVATMVALLLRGLMDPWLGSSVPFITLFAAVAAAVCVGGNGPGWAAAVIGYLACAYFFIEPRQNIVLLTSADFITLVLYLLTCGIIIALGEGMRRAHREAGARRQQAEIETCERLALQAAEQAQSARWRVTLSSVGDAVITTDQTGRITFLNTVAESLTGWKRKEAVEQQLAIVFQIVDEQTREPAENPATRVLKEGTVVGLANHTVLIAKDGTERPIDDSAAPIRDDSGDIVGCVLVFRDVTERRRLERIAAERLRSSQFLAAIVQSSGDAIVSKSLDGIVQSWNAAAEHLFGYTAKQAIGRHISFLFPPDRLDEEDIIIAQIRAGKSVNHFETERVRSNGVRIPISLTISPIKDEAGRIIGASKIARDITERRQAEARLAREVNERQEAEASERRQLEQWRVTLASIGDGVITTDNEARVTFLNPVAELLTGWGLTEARGQRLTDVFQICHEQTRQEVENPAVRAMREGLIVGLANHTLLISRSGEARSIDDSAAPIRDSAGQVIGGVLVFRDVGDRRQIENARAEAQLRIESVVNNVVDGIITIDESGVVESINPAGEKLFGYQAAEVIGQNVRMLMPEPFHTEHDQYIANYRQTGEAKIIGIGREVVGRRKDGSTFPMDLAVSEFDIGSRQYFTGIVRDITERKKALSALRVQGELLDLAHDAIIVRSAEGMIASWNRGAELMYGWSKEEAIGRNIHALLTTEFPATLSQIQHDISERGSWHGTLTHTRRDGSRVTVASSWTTRRSPEDGPGIVLEINQDITEIRRAERALKEADRQKDEFLATLSHELRTPLTAVLGWARLIQKNPSDAKTVHEGISVIARNAKVQVDLIADLLDMSRIISGKIRLEIEDVQLPVIIQAAIDSVRQAADAKTITIETVLDPITEPIRGDPSRLQQVIWNLLTNAVKFTPHGGRIQIAVAQHESQAQISVSDTGQGIPAAFLPFVFERFRQADSSAARIHGGLGLGLAIVKQLVELHGGRIRAESPGEDQGSTFTVELPLAKTPRIEAHRISDFSTTATGHAASSDLTGIKVLAVDDEADTRILLKRILEDAQANVLTAVSAEEALRLLNDQPPDILLSDIGMPGKDGYELVREMRASGNRTPAIAITAFARLEDRVQAVHAGYQAHVSKPIEPNELIAAVAAFAKRTAS